MYICSLPDKKSYQFNAIAGKFLLSKAIKNRSKIQRQQHYQTEKIINKLTKT